MSLMAVLVVGGVVVLALAVINRQALLRVIGAGRAQVGEFGRALEEADPLALLNQAIDDGVTKIEQAQRGLEKAKYLCRAVKRQVESGEKDEARLTNRIKVAVEQGDPNNTTKDYALQLADIRTQLTSNKEQLKAHEEAYENWAAQVELGKRKVRETREKARTLGVKLEMSEHQSQLAEFADNFNFDPNAMNQGLARAEELVQAKIDKNLAKSDVALDMSKQALAEAADDELERQAQADAILAEFKK